MINPHLYSALCVVFGQRNVIPVKQGQRGDFRFGMRTRVRNGQSENYRTIVKADNNNTFVGEEFRVPCPFCHDHIPRLYINHLWGTKDKLTNSRYLWMANCWNENCMSDFENRKRLYEMVRDHAQLDAPLNQGRSAPRDRVADWPGDMWSFSDLVRRDPKHPAAQLAFARFWDVEELTRLFDVRVLISPRYWREQLRDRIVVPVYSGDKVMKTWTARRTHEEQAAKWLHCPYVGTGNAIYGLASARRHKVPAVVEGPADCWPHKGRNAGVFGKVVQNIKAKRIAKAFKDCEAIAVALDPKQDFSSFLRGHEHHLDVAMRTISEYTEVPLIRVELPDVDPGGLDEDIFDYHIRRSADEQKIRIS